MDILFASTNQNKVNRIKKLIKDVNINFISLADLDYKIEEPEENGSDGVENAIIKARYYFDKLKIKIPVLTQDDTLFLFGVSEEDNPKKDIKLPIIKKYGQFTDDYAYQYYSNLIRKYDKEYLDFEFRYGHAICYGDVLEGSSSILPGRLCAQINSTKTPGYFISDMMKVNLGNNWEYYSNLSDEELVDQDKDIKRSVNFLLSKLGLLA